MRIEQSIALYTRDVPCEEISLKTPMKERNNFSFSVVQL